MNILKPGLLETLRELTGSIAKLAEDFQEQPSTTLTIIREAVSSKFPQASIQELNYYVKCVSYSLEKDYCVFIFTE